MSHIRLLFSMLCVAVALTVLLVKPLSARADNNALPSPVPARPPSHIKPVLQPLPIVKFKPKPKRRTQQHRSFGSRLVGFAEHFVGTRYVWGGTSPSGFDCSGLVQFVYAHFGIPLPRTTYGQFGRGRRVSRWGLRPGDLVFFDGVGHVGMYVGNGRFIHAPHTGTRVRIQMLSGSYGSRFVGGRRLRPA
jgi:cell wall-associated NlpC family hydrolase